MTITLPDGGEAIISDDETESYVYIFREWYPIRKSKKLVQILKNEVEWQQEAVTVYGKTVQQPRRIYACGDEGVVHRYSGLTLPLNPWIPEIRRIKRKITHQTGVKFNSCLLNEYENGKKCIGYHGDKEVDAYLHTVATVSLGGTRDFVMRKVLGGGKFSPQLVSVPLKNGDLVLMYGNTQKHYQHSIPKRSEGEYRVSLTYRYLNS